MYQFMFVKNVILHVIKLTYHSYKYYNTIYNHDIHIIFIYVKYCITLLMFIVLNIFMITIYLTQ